MKVKETYTVLALLMLLNVVIRLPVTPHEVGNDSFVIHWMAKSIQMEGKLTWILHPASFFGLYPYSYPPLIPALLSMLSTISGLTIESGILLLSIIFAFCGVLFGYLLGREFTGDERVAYITAFCFSLSPVFISFTLWTASTRHLLILLVSLILFLIFRFERTKNPMFAFLTLGFIFSSMFIHRTYLLIFTLILPAYFASKLFFYLRRKHKFFEGVNNRLHILIPAVFLIFFMLQFSNIGVFKNLRDTYQTGLFFSGTSSATIFLNMCMDYLSRSGILFIFAPVAIVSLMLNIKRNRYGVNELFMLIFLLLGSLILLNGKYVTLFFLPIFSLLAAKGLIILSDKKSNRIRHQYLIVLILIASLSFSIFMTYHWHFKTEGNSQTPWADDKTFNTAKFIENKLDERTVFSSDKLLRRRLSAYSYNTVFPMEDIQEVTYGYIAADILKSKWILIKPGGGKTFWTVNKPRSSMQDWDVLLWSNLSRLDAVEIIDYYDIGYVAENEENEYLRKYPIYADLRDNKNRVYDNGKHIIWYLEGTY